MSEVANTRWYRRGSISVSPNSTKVTGVNTNWLTSGIKPGATFRVDASPYAYEVVEVVSDTELTLGSVYAGNAVSSAAYSVDRNFQSTTNAEFAKDLTKLLRIYEQIQDGSIKTLQGKSAYDLAKENGFTGTQAQWLETLKAAQEWSTLDERTSILVSGEYGIHNCLCRGKNLGTAPTTAQMAAIRAGTFDDMWLGDYWQRGSKKFRIVQFNYYIGEGSSWADQNNNNPLRAKNHVVVVSEGRLYDMNNQEQFALWETIPEGGYLATPHNEFIQTTGLEILKSFFGEENLIPHLRSISSVIAEHKVTSRTAETVIADSVSAHQFFGDSPVINETDRDLYNFDRFALATLNPAYSYRKWGMKQLKTLAAASGCVCRCNYGILDAGDPNSKGSHELFVMCCLG